MATEEKSVPDISKLSLGQLTQLADQIATLRANLLVKRRQELASQFKELAGAEGISLDDVVRELNVTAGRASDRTPRERAKRPSNQGKVAAKYRNPTDPSQVWTGRGRKPYWVQAHLANGGTAEELLIR